VLGRYRPLGPSAIVHVSKRFAEIDERLPAGAQGLLQLAAFASLGVARCCSRAAAHALGSRCGSPADQWLPQRKMSNPADVAGESRMRSFGVTSIQQS
jgi:hypothetical protein